MTKPPGRKYLLVGGLVAMGFDPSGRYLLVVSHSGRGVFAVGSWERVARDPTHVSTRNGFIEGIGPVAGIEILVDERNQNKDEIRLTTPDGRFALFGESDGITIDVNE